MIAAQSFLLSLVIASCAWLGSARADDSKSVASVHEDPSFTGTLLSTRGATVDEGHVVVMPYFYSTEFGGLYNNNWRIQSASVSRTNILQTYVIYGLTSRIDVEIGPQWVGNHAENESSVGFGDFPLQIGFHALHQREDSWVPDIRIWVQETFPTGSFTDLSPTKTGLTGTGGGSYATTLGIGAQKIFRFGDDHVLRGRMNASYGFYSPVTVEGFNSYGGGFGTLGRVQPGSVTTLTLAGEYALMRHVVLALDISFQFANATRFTGNPGIAVSGSPATVGKGYSELLTVAPAVEYIWNTHLGVIAGPWLSLRGQNATQFFGAVGAIYLYW